jgi:glucose-6-phosphate dehydrogenase assembly protein OpcA
VTADVATLGTWAARDVRLGQVLDALDRLRHGSERRATRTSVMNLVVVARTRAEADRACEVTRQFGRRHPTRTVVLLTEPAGEGIDADITLHGITEGGLSVWSEDIVLTVKGAAADHLLSLVEPLTLADLPLALWFVGSLPSPAEPLCKACDALIVDSKELGDERAFADIRSLQRQHTVVDLTWIRLTPWRQLLAGLFDGHDFRPFVAGVRSAEVHGKSGPRHLLGGWLVDRLRLPRAEVHLTEARHVTIRLVAEAGGRRGDFVVTRQEGERLVRASATVEGGPAHQDVLPLPETSLGWSLGQALTDLESDRTYGHALHAALGFLR